MASKQFLRRLPLLSRGAFPDVANDVLPIVAGSADSASNGRSSLAAGPAPPAAAGPRPVLKPGFAPQTLGQWTQRLSHLQSLRKPLGPLGISTVPESPRAAWPVGNASSKQLSTTDIAATTLPAIAGLLKHKLPVSAASAIAFNARLPTGPSSTANGLTVTSTPSTSIASSPSVASLATASTYEGSCSPISLSGTTIPGPATRPATIAPPSAPDRQSPIQPQPTTQIQSQPLQPHLHHQRRQSSSRGHSAAANSSIQLNKNIMACRTTEELLAVVQSRGAHFDYFNISTALARVPKLAAAPLNAPPSATAGNIMHVQVGAYPGPYNHALAAPPPQPPPPMPPPLPAGPAQSGPAGPHGAAASCVLPSDLHVDASGRSLLDHLAALMVTHIDSFDARGLANSAWAFGKLKYVPSGALPSVIASAARSRMHEFSPQNLSNLVWSFVYMHHADEALLSAASQFVRARVSEFKPQELANIVWAFASLGHHDDQMLQAVASQAQRIAPLFKEQELSNVLWALGKMSLRGRPEVFEALMAETRAKLPAFLPQGISNVAWALASVGHADVLFLDRVVAQCGSQLAAFDVQALANMVWAMASLNYCQPAFVSAVVNECLIRGLDRLSPQNLSNILWGCATLNHRDPRMLSAWANQTLEKLPSFEPQGVSNTAWAFARLGFHSPQLFQALGAAALHKLDGFTAQGLSNLAWAMATAGHTQPRLFESLARHATTLAPSFNAQNCSVTLWACATLRHHDERLFDVLLDRLVVELKGCEPQNLANALWAVARMGHPMSPDRARPLVRQAMALLPRMSQQELCNTMWAVACLDLMDETHFSAFCDCLQGLSDISPEGMHQAYHAQLMFHSSLARGAGVPLAQLEQLASATPSASRHLLPRLPEPIHTVAANMWATAARDVHVSRLQQEVSGALGLAGVPHAVEWMTDDQNFSIDIGLQVNAQPTAVEVNGSHHYASNDAQRPLGDMAIRSRLLQDRGWHVVNVGFADWEAMGQTPSERGNSLVGRIASSLEEWDWRYVGLPQRAPGVLSAPPQTVVTPPPPMDVVLPKQQEQSAASLQQALAATIGLSTLFPPEPLSIPNPVPCPPAPAPSPFPGVADLSGRGWPSALGLGFGSWGPFGSLGLGTLGDLANASFNSFDNTVGSLPSAGGAVGFAGAGSWGFTSMESVSDAQAVQAAVEAAEALIALPDGNMLLEKQMYEVLGVRLPPLVAAAPSAGPSAQPDVSLLEAMAQLSALQHRLGGGLPLGGSPLTSSGSSSEDDSMDMVSDDDLERVVQFALA